MAIVERQLPFDPVKLFREMVDAGLIKPEVVNGVKGFRITDEGRAYLKRRKNREFDA